MKYLKVLFLVSALFICFNFSYGFANAPEGAVYVCKYGTSDLYVIEKGLMINMKQNNVGPAGGSTLVYVDFSDADRRARFGEPTKIKGMLYGCYWVDQEENTLIQYRSLGYCYEDQPGISIKGENPNVILNKKSQNEDLYFIRIGLKYIVQNNNKYEEHGNVVKLKNQ